MPMPSKRPDTIVLVHGFWVTVLRKNSAPVMQHRPVGGTRDGVRSVRSEPQFGLAGRNDAAGVALCRAMPTWNGKAGS